MVRSERFEMRMDGDLLERIDEWRGRQGTSSSRAEAIRQLLEFALSGALKNELQLDKPQRLIVWMLSEVLKGQKDYENKESIELIQQAIYGGHLWALDWEFTGVLHSHTDDREAVSMVVDTLDMWSFIESGYLALSQAEKNRLAKEVPYLGKNPQFIGFDGNNESEEMGIAQFLVNKMGRFAAFKDRSLNSHMPRVAKYRQMLVAFESIRANLVGREMSVDEMITVLRLD